MFRRDRANGIARFPSVFPLVLIAAVAAITADFSALPQTSGAPVQTRSAARSQSGARRSGASTPIAPQSAEAAVARWMASLTLREEIAQLIVIPFNGHPFRPHSREYARFLSLVSREHIGGLILVNLANGRVVSKADPLQTAGFINRMQRLSKVPLIVAGDFERGNAG